jgi:hypothetical protein
LCFETIGAHLYKFHSVTTLKGDLKQHAHMIAHIMLFTQAYADKLGTAYPSHMVSAAIEDEIIRIQSGVGAFPNVPIFGAQDDMIRPGGGN